MDGAGLAAEWVQQNAGGTDGRGRMPWAPSKEESPPLPSGQQDLDGGAMADGAPDLLPAEPADAPGVPDARASGAEDAGAGDAGLGLGQGVLLWFPFDDKEGNTTAVNRSGGGQGAELRGVDPRMAWVAGRCVGAVDLAAAGQDGHLVVPRPGRLDGIDSGLSIAVWIRLPARRDPGVIVTRRDSFRLEVKEGLLKVSIEGADRLPFELESDRPVPTARWVHAAMVFDRVAVRLYLDGNRVAIASHAGGIAPSDQPLTIGASRLADGSDERTQDHLPGELDELLIYGRNLHTREITALADGLLP